MADAIIGDVLPVEVNKFEGSAIGEDAKSLIGEGRGFAADGATDFKVLEVLLLGKELKGLPR